jgi:hypothetical protein
MNPQLATQKLGTLNSQLENPQLKNSQLENPKPYPAPLLRMARKKSVLAGPGSGPG